MTRQIYQLASLVSSCTICDLCKTRKTAVTFRGSTSASVMFIGEAPGKNEDELGLPFVGRSGVLLDEIIEEIGLKQGEVYIANVVKCRPPDNRVPEDEELASCRPYLDLEISTLKPKAIVTLGSTASNALMSYADKLQWQPIGALRQYLHSSGPGSYRDTPVYPTYHPAYLLRNPSAKKLVLEDLKLMTEALNEKD